MAYRDTNIKRLKNFFKNPGQGVQKIVPFLKSRLFPSYRRFLERIGVYRYSTPFVNHEAFLPHVNFKGGFFVQCGGMDGYGNDPTYYLERVLGWTGIIVEPLPIHTLCQKNRPSSTVYNTAAGTFEDRNKRVDFVDCLGMSFVKGSIDNEKEWIHGGETSQGINAEVIEVTLTPVQDLIDNYFNTHPRRDIDLFVVDVEGYELNVLNGLNFEKNPPKQLLIESTPARADNLKSFMEEKQYELIQRFNNDYLFKRASTL